MKARKVGPLSMGFCTACNSAGWFEGTGRDLSCARCGQRGTLDTTRVISAHKRHLLTMERESGILWTYPKVSQASEAGGFVLKWVLIAAVSLPILILVVYLARG